MKMPLQNAQAVRNKPGFTVTVFVLALLIFITALIAANTVAMNRLDREVRAVEKHQIQRLNPGTNAIHQTTVTNSPAAK
jgi:hypothetical protein